MAITKKPIQDNARTLHAQQRHDSAHAGAAAASAVTRVGRDPTQALTQPHVQLQQKQQHQHQQGPRHSAAVHVEVVQKCPTRTRAQAATVEVVTPEWHYDGSERCDFSFLLVKEQRRMGTSRGQKAIPQAPAIVVRAKGLGDHAVNIRADLWDYGPSTNARGARILPRPVTGGEQLVKLRDDVTISCTENVSAFGPVGEDGYRYATVRCYITRGARVRCRKDHVALRLCLVAEDPKAADDALDAIIEATEPVRTARVSISEKAMCPRECDRRKKVANVQKRSNSRGPVPIARRPSPIGTASFSFSAASSTSSSRTTSPMHSLQGAMASHAYPTSSSAAWPLDGTRRYSKGFDSPLESSSSSLLGFCPPTLAKRSSASCPSFERTALKRVRYDSPSTVTMPLLQRSQTLNVAGLNNDISCAQQDSVTARRLAMSIDNIKMQLKLGEMKMAQLGLPIKHVTSTPTTSFAPLPSLGAISRDQFATSSAALPRQTSAMRGMLAGSALARNQISGPVARFQSTLAELPSSSLVQALRQLDSFPNLTHQRRWE